MKKLFENFRGYVNEDESQTKEQLLQRLQELLEDWPACEKETLLTRHDLRPRKRKSSLDLTNYIY